jgi:hypothetical protein
VEFHSMEAWLQGLFTTLQAYLLSSSVTRVVNSSTFVESS